MTKFSGLQHQQTLTWRAARLSGEAGGAAYANDDENVKMAAAAAAIVAIECIVVAIV
jgi:hypothetical protein